MKMDNAHTEAVLDRARGIVAEHYESLRGHGAGARLRALLEQEFGKPSLRGISTVMLSGIVAARSNPHITGKKAAARSAEDAALLRDTRALKREVAEHLRQQQEPPTETLLESHSNNNQRFLLDCSGGVAIPDHRALLREAIDHALWLDEHGYIEQPLLSEIMASILATRGRPTGNGNGNGNGNGAQ